VLQRQQVGKDTHFRVYDDESRDYQREHATLLRTRLPLELQPSRRMARVVRVRRRSTEHHGRRHEVDLGPTGPPQQIEPGPQGPQPTTTTTALGPYRTSVVRPGYCAKIRADETITAVVGGFTMEACLRAPHLVQNAALVRKMLHSVHVSASTSPTSGPRSTSTTPATSVPPTAVAPIDNAIEVYGNCTSPSVEPSEIVDTCADYGTVYDGLHWTTWTGTSATAVGTGVYHHCTPYCPLGSLRVPNTKITLSVPVRTAAGFVWSEIQEQPEPPGYETGPYHGGPQPLPTRPV
jgi:hypothetical protein